LIGKPKNTEKCLQVNFKERLLVIKIIKFKSSPHTKAELFLTYAAYGVSAIILIILFIENFIFSSGFDILRFREIDDVAFQDTLRRTHLAISSDRFSQLLVINDYAYGWIFWFPLALITYPFYLLSAHFLIDWPLIVFPRQISLGFGIASLFLLRKILKKYGTPEWVAAACVFVFLLFPSFGFFSLRFGTVNEVLFFCLLSLFLTVADDPSTLRGRLLISISLALAGGVKLSGLLIAPLIVVMVAIRYKYRSLAVLIRDLALVTAVFLICLIAFSNPALIAYPFQIEYWQDYHKTLSYFIATTQQANGPLNPFKRGYSIFFGSVGCLVYISLLFWGLCMRAVKADAKRLDLLAIIVTLLFVATYLFYFVRNGNSATLYFTSISFLLLFGLPFLCDLPRGKIILGAVIFLELIDLSIRVSAQRGSDIQATSLNHLTYYMKDFQSIHLIKESNRISECIRAKDKKWDAHVFVDFTVPTGLNSLSFPNACISVAWNNLSSIGKYCGHREIDYIVLDKQAPGALSQDLFETKIKSLNPKMASDLLIDRDSRRAIINGDYFDGRHFTKACDLDTVLVYQAGKE
jgi:hypothetical protein